MYLGEIEKTDNIVISFDLGDRHFDFTTTLLPDTDKEDARKTIYSECVTVNDLPIHIDSRCNNVEIRYLNQISGRTHFWKDVSVEYEPEGRYRIHCDNDSTPENRRRAVRIGINRKSDCIISLLNGRYPCTVNDISVTGIGLNIDVALADKNLHHRLIYTHFEDHILRKRFYIKARCLHCTKLDNKTVRCGCEIISITPSINEYINIKQTHRLAKLANYEEPAIREIPAEKADYEPEKEPETKDRLWISPKFLKRHSMYKEGDICPVCESGRLHETDGCFLCDVCESMLE